MKYECVRDNTIITLIGIVVGFATWLQVSGLLFSNHLGAISCLIISTVAGYLVHTRLLPELRQLCLRAQLQGHDLYRKGFPDYNQPIPEALGVAPAAGYIAAVSAILAYTAWSGMEGSWALTLGAYCALFGAALGFVDDVLELRWRDKLILPLLFSLSSAISYAGARLLPLPAIFLKILGPLGPFIFSVYLVCMPVFCLNAINIYAGISGLESGQSIVIGLTLMLESLFCIREGRNVTQNLQALLVLAPFCAVSLPMILQSRVSRKTFVGDTYVSFAGCAIAAAALIGHFPLKALLFLSPQLLNFILSIPQLFGIVHCPRHRLPEALPNGTLRTTFPRNLNTTNFVLWLTGPISEEKLSALLVCGQIGLNLCAIYICRLWPKDLTIKYMIN